MFFLVPRAADLARRPIGLERVMLETIGAVWLEGVCLGRGRGRGGEETCRVSKAQDRKGMRAGTH